MTSPTAIVRRRSLFGLGRIDLILHLVGRDFAVRYRRSILGGLWSLVQPLSRLVVLSFLFTQVLPLGGNTKVSDYTAFLFVGLIGWLWFSAAVLSGCSSPVDRADLILRPGVPRTVVPVVAVLAAGLDYLAALPILLLYLLIVADGLPATGLLMPVLLLLQLILTLGVTFLLAAANVFVRDIRIVTDVVLLLGFYITPVFYRPSQVPDSFQWAIDGNPVATLLEMQRNALVEGDLPSLGAFAQITAVCLAIGAIGLVAYRRASPYFGDEL